MHGTRAVAAGGLTVGEVARRAGLTRTAVRWYEARGLLPPVERTESGYRLYSEHGLAQVLAAATSRADQGEDARLCRILDEQHQ